LAGHAECQYGLPLDSICIKIYSKIRAKPGTKILAGLSHRIVAYGYSTFYQLKDSMVILTQNGPNATSPGVLHADWYWKAPHKVNKSVVPSVGNIHVKQLDRSLVIGQMNESTDGVQFQYQYRFVGEPLPSPQEIQIYSTLGATARLGS
jgi:hypothetical protein